MKYRYSVRYRRLEPGRRVYRVTVTARDADEARRAAAIRDPLFGTTTETPRRGARLTTLAVVDGELREVEPEQADPMTAAKAREDLERGTAHFDRDYVEWRGTQVEVVD